MKAKTTSVGMEQENTVLSCCDKICKAIGRKNFDEVVHKLIYPALLGSMIYDIVKFDFCDNWWYKSGIVLFYFLDYFHVFTFFDKKFKEIKKEPICIGVDFLVSVFLTLAYHLNCPILLCIIPLLFVPYAYKMITEKLFNIIPIWSLHIVFMIVTICIYCCSALNEVWLIYIMTLIYFLLMFIEICHSNGTLNKSIETQQPSARTFVKPPPVRSRHHVGSGSARAAVRNLKANNINKK